jgi:hypothetical protein
MTTYRVISMRELLNQFFAVERGAVEQTARLSLSFS